MFAIDRQRLVTMLERAAAEIRAQHGMLSELDSHGGDGDHGTTMLRAMDTVGASVAEADGADLGVLLNAVGWGLLGVDGGATGPLFGAFFTGMGSVATGKSVLDAATLTQCLEAGLAAVRRYSKAQPGDKTLLDALLPAVEAARDALDKGEGIAGVLHAAARAAQTGAESTKNLQARCGRAKNIGEASIGHQDAGATSMALIFQGLQQGAA